MQVEKAQSPDIPSLTALRLAYLTEDHGELSPAEAAAVTGSLPGYFRSHLGRDLFCYVLREGDDIVSCAFLLVVEKPMSPAFLNGKTGTVLNVYTRPSSRHKGYAKAVMEALLADARALGLCVIELKATEAGYPLYRSLGFRDDVSRYRLMCWENPQT